MMDFYEEPENDPKPVLFWLIMFATMIIAVAFVAEVFVRFYLDIT